jgi:hypothetical protein
MNYECILFDEELGHHKRGTGQTPLIATVNAFRLIMQHKVPAGRESEIPQQIGQPEVLQVFYMVNPTDGYFENLMTLKEEVHDLMVLLRCDRTKETMYVPCGIVRTII